MNLSDMIKQYMMTMRAQQQQKNIDAYNPDGQSLGSVAPQALMRGNQPESLTYQANMNVNDLSSIPFDLYGQQKNLDMVNQEFLRQFLEANSNPKRVAHKNPHYVMGDIQSVVTNNGPRKIK